jgi:hypothetical protein
MAYTATQLADLRAAIAEGVTRVAANGRTVEYRSLDEMRKLERIMSEELEQSTRRPERIYYSFRRA